MEQNLSVSRTISMLSLQTKKGGLGAPATSLSFYLFFLIHVFSFAVWLVQFSQ